jgi:hypothetical protein
MKSLILLIVSALVFSTNGFCNNPSDINVTVKEGAIEVVVFHSVSDPTTHYIKRVEVKLNGEKTAEKNFTSQTDDMTQKTGFDIASLKKGDVLEIAAYCSRSGELKKSVTVE